MFRKSLPYTAIVDWTALDACRQTDQTELTASENLVPFSAIQAQSLPRIEKFAEVYPG